MLITYSIFLIIAVLFKIFHWPGANLILLITPIFGLIDILVQAIRNKGDKETNVYSAIFLLFVSLFILFKFLKWPGSSLIFVVFGLFSLLYFLRHFQKKVTRNFRFYVITCLFLFASVNFFVKGSTFTRLYMLEDPFNKTEAVPHFIIQSLAFEYYSEGDYEKAERLIERNIAHLEVLVSQNQTMKQSIYQEIDAENLEKSKRDLDAIKNRTWYYPDYLFPEDRTE